MLNRYLNLFLIVFFITTGIILLNNYLANSYELTNISLLILLISNGLAIFIFSYDRNKE